MSPPDEADRVRAARGPFAGQEGHLDAPYSATPHDLVGLMLDLAGLGPADFLVDLGSGDGRIAIEAARRGARALGVDIASARIAEAEAAARRQGLADRVGFRREDMFDTPLGQASVVTLFLLPHVNNLLQARLLAELRPGSRVISHAFPMSGWHPEAEIEVERRRLYKWVIPTAPQDAVAA